MLKVFDAETALVLYWYAFDQRTGDHAVKGM